MATDKKLNLIKRAGEILQASSLHGRHSCPFLLGDKMGQKISVVQTRNKIRQLVRWTVAEIGAAGHPLDSTIQRGTDPQDLVNLIRSYNPIASATVKWAEELLADDMTQRIACIDVMGRG